MAKLLSGTRIYGNTTIDTYLVVSGTNASNSITTGAVVVTGGLGVSGNIYSTAVYADNFYTRTGVSILSSAAAAYDKANAANVLAQSAFNTANLKFNTSGGAITGDVTITGNITPSTSNTYYLGSPTNRFKSLYVGPGSVDIGGVVLGASADGSLTITSSTGNSVSDIIVIGSSLPSINQIARTANASFVQANIATVVAQAGYNQANATNAYAFSAYAQANATNSYAVSGFAKANSANVLAQAAYNQANATNTYAASAYSQANTANGLITFVDTKAQAAFDAANGVVTTATSANVTAQTALALAEALLAQGFPTSVDNVARLLAQTAYDAANNTLIYLGGIDTRQNVNILLANTVATRADLAAAAAYNLANTLNSAGLIVSDEYARQTANAAFTKANSEPVAFSAYGKANSANILAQAAFTQANIAQAGAASAFLKANNALLLAQYATDTTNTYSSSIGNIPAIWNTANGAYITANAAFLKANTGSLSAQTTADAGYLKANSANILAQAAFTQANIAQAGAATAYIIANNASTTVNTFTASISAAFTKANSANSLAQAAFDKANTGISLGGTVNGDLVLSGNLTVLGQTTYANSETILIKDNIITLNAAISQTGLPIANAGIEVDRGLSANASLIWSETNDKWVYSGDGVNYSTIASDERVTVVYDHSNSTITLAQAAFDRANASATTSIDDFARLQANAAFAAANNITDTAVLKTGSTITGAINITNTTISTSNTSGALIVSGGVGVAGNVYTTSVYANNFYGTVDGGDF